MHECSNSVGLLGSLHNTVLHLRDVELWYKPRETMVQQNSSNLHLKQRKTNTAIHVYINIPKTRQGHKIAF